jgi:hypothetical protein
MTDKLPEEEEVIPKQVADEPVVVTNARPVKLW